MLDGSREGRQMLLDDIPGRHRIGTLIFVP
jgi:hypothetical protein